MSHIQLAVKGCSSYVQYKQPTLLVIITRKRSIPLSIYMHILIFRVFWDGQTTWCHFRTLCSGQTIKKHKQINVLLIEIIILNFNKNDCTSLILFNNNHLTSRLAKYFSLWIFQITFYFVIFWCLLHVYNSFLIFISPITKKLMS